MDDEKRKKDEINPNAKRLKPELLWFGTINKLGPFPDGNELKKGETKFKECVEVIDHV